MTLSDIAFEDRRFAQLVCHICLHPEHFSFQDDSLLLWQGHLPSCTFDGLLDVVRTETVGPGSDYVFVLAPGVSFLSTFMVALYFLSPIGELQILR